MSINFKPATNKILVEKEKAMDTYGTAGIKLPTDDQETYPEGTVIAIAEERIIYTSKGEVPINFRVKEGDKIIFNPNSGFVLKLPDLDTNKEFVVLEEQDIIGYRAE